MSSATIASRRGRRRSSALGNDLRRFWNLTWTLAVTEFKVRFFGSALGYLWSLMKPLLQFAVLYLVFTEIVRIGGDVKNYPVYLLTAIMLWTYFAETTSGAVQSLVNQEGLLRKIRFPRMVVPLSISLVSLFNLGMNMIAVFVFMAISQIEVTWGFLWLPVLVLYMVILSTGTAMLLSALYVRYRDIGPIWDVTLQLLFYASPIIYVLTAIPEEYQRILAANPIAIVMTQMRHAIIDPEAPDIVEAIGAAPRLLIPAAITVIVCTLGWIVFNREAPRIAENL